MTQSFKTERRLFLMAAAATSAVAAIPAFAKKAHAFAPPLMKRHCPEL